MLGETAMARVKRLNGGKLNARTFQSQQTEIAMQIDALNRSIRARNKHNQDPLTTGEWAITHRGSCTKAMDYLYDLRRASALVHGPED